MRHGLPLLACACTLAVTPALSQALRDFSKPEDVVPITKSAQQFDQLRTPDLDVRVIRIAGKVAGKPFCTALRSDAGLPDDAAWQDDLAPLAAGFGGSTAEVALQRIVTPDSANKVRLRAAVPTSSKPVFVGVSTSVGKDVYVDVHQLMKKPEAEVAPIALAAGQVAYRQFALGRSRDECLVVAVTRLAAKDAKAHREKYAGRLAEWMNPGPGITPPKRVKNGSWPAYKIFGDQIPILAAPVVAADGHPVAVLAIEAPANTPREVGEAYLSFLLDSKYAPAQKEGQAVAGLYGEQVMLSWDPRTIQDTLPGQSILAAGPRSHGMGYSDAPSDAYF